MTIEYFPESDTLSITFREAPYQATGEDTNDSDVVLYYDEQHRLAEIEVSHASKRSNLSHLRDQPCFKEVCDAVPAFDVSFSEPASR
jgi:uncharacterized protein YuzE